MGYMVCHQCGFTMFSSEIEDLKKKLKIKTDAHDRDGKALIEAHKRIAKLEKLVRKMEEEVKGYETSG